MSLKLISCIYARQGLVFFILEVKHDIKHNSKILQNENRWIPYVQ